MLQSVIAFAISRGYAIAMSSPETQKSKYFKEQFDDEEVKLVFRKHPVVMRKGIVYASLGLLAGTIPAVFNPTFTIYFGGLAVGLVLSALIMLPFWIRWYFSVYILTNQRFIQQTKSMLQSSVVDIGLDQIQMINYRVSGFQETLLGFGTIVVQTFVGELTIHDVHHPAKLQKEMVGILRDIGVHPVQRMSTEQSE